MDMYSYGVNYPQVKLNDFIHAVCIPDTVESIPSFRRVLFETLHFSNQKAFSSDLLGFAHDFSNPRFFEITDFSNKFCFLSKICTRFLELENSEAKKNWS